MIDFPLYCVTLIGCISGKSNFHDVPWFCIVNFVIRWQSLSCQPNKYDRIETNPAYKYDNDKLEGENTSKCKELPRLKIRKLLGWQLNIAIKNWNPCYSSHIVKVTVKVKWLRILSLGGNRLVSKSIASEFLTERTLCISRYFRYKYWSHSNFSVIP